MVGAVVSNALILMSMCGLAVRLTWRDYCITLICAIQEVREEEVPPIIIIVLELIAMRIIVPQPKI